MRLYGGFLALINPLTAAFWILDYRIGDILSRSTPAVCWPFHAACGNWRVLDGATAELLVAIFGAVGLLNALQFFREEADHSAVVGLVVVTAIKTAIVLQDYRLVANQHYISGWMTLVYVISQDRRYTTRALIAAIYFWAGTLKLNTDWLSGTALLGSRPFGMPPALIPSACAYVVLLEVVGSWFLLSKRAAVRWLVLGQFALFHLASFWVVGYFYPLLMVCVLSVFPLTWLSPEGADHPVPRWSLAVLAFSLLQLVPRVASSDPAITGEGRMLALNMFDAPISCVATLTTGSGPPKRLQVPYLQPRIACDPVVFLGVAYSACTPDSGIIGARRLVIRSKRATAEHFSAIVDVPDICKVKLTYSLFGGNAWIRNP